MRASQSPRPLRCVHCRQLIQKDNPHFPFCSSRCRLLDLGRWLEGDYRIAGEKVEIPEDQDQNS